MRRLRAGLTATITGSLLATASLLAIAPAAPALEVDEQTSFVAVPTKAKLINYRWYAFEGGAVMYVVMELPPGAQAGLGGISLEQIRGVRPAFYYGAIQPTAFLGTPRRQGAAVPVSASFSNEARSVAISFPDPVPAGSTVTVAFKLGVNPPADLYVYSISATPWGPNPIEQDVGVVQMSILDNGGI
ncbi:hypothetical protein CWE17_08970 [Synechococcus sp. BS56D]|jgi:hypothetical protein|uniref:DUF2808 domain-containing protein n=1 Tax=Synechococcus sp. BS56D TaxID=2055944 RepID=UPI001040C04B|nr:DUF2808 domain-containing protein [Synechococcus sp. BS56D]TCD56780.1 hypothetical protein CWE17_08970 [Synechococcus sp. BS56D]